MRDDARHAHPGPCSPTRSRARSRAASPARPFCSLRLIDLGAWLCEPYRAPGKPLSSEPVPAPDAARAGA